MNTFDLKLSFSLYIKNIMIHFTFTVKLHQLIRGKTSAVRSMLRHRLYFLVEYFLKRLVERVQNFGIFLTALKKI